MIIIYCDTETTGLVPTEDRITLFQYHVLCFEIKIGVGWVGNLCPWREDTSQTCSEERAVDDGKKEHESCQSCCDVDWCLQALEVNDLIWFEIPSGDVRFIASGVDEARRRSICLF